MTENRQDRDVELDPSEEWFRLVVEASPAPIVIVDAAGRIVLVNKRIEEWFDYSRDDLLGQEIEILIPERFHHQHRIDRDFFLTTPTVRPMGVGHHLIAQRRDGSEFPVDISLHPIETKDGMLVMAHLVDAIDRQLATEEVQRRHAVERLALLGQLAASVAHEIRNPLGVIRNAAYYLQMIQQMLDEDARASIREIQQEVTRANKIVGDLLDFARDAPQQTEVFDVVGRIEKLIAEYQQNDRPIELTGPVPELLVRADPDQVDRILGNLIRNAVQATEEADTISIAICAQENSASIEVSDSGSGIVESDRERIFDPLFTTRAKGIGIGLTVSRRYAQKNGGQLTLIDKPGPGTTFRLTLPLATVGEAEDVRPAP